MAAGPGQVQPWSVGRGGGGRRRMGRVGVTLGFALCPRALSRPCLYLQLSEMASLYGFLSGLYILSWFWNQLSFELMTGSPLCDLVKM